MDNPLDKFKAHDWNTGAWFHSVPSGTVDSLQQNVMALDTEARLLAVMFLTETDGARAAEVLLQMTGDENEQVAAGAAQGLNSIVSGLPPDVIAEALPRRRYPVVRAQLYLAMARARDVGALEVVRQLTQSEHDDEARINALVAAILLGGKQERGEFKDRLRSASPRDAQQLAEKLQLIGDQRLAQGMLPWLSNSRPVTRIGSDADGRMLRMCDLAVLTAHRLGVEFPIPTESPANFDAETIGASRVALEALAE